MVVVLVPIGVILLAIVAALFVYCWYKIVYYLSLALIPQLPGVFSYVNDFVDWLGSKALAATDAAYSKVLDWAGAAMDPIVTLLNAIVAGSEGLWDASMEFSYSVYNMFRALVTQTIPNAINGGINEAEQVIIPKVQQIAHQAFIDSVNWTQNEANTVWSNTINLVQGTRDDVLGTINATTQAFDSILNGIENELGQVEHRLGQAEGEIGALGASLAGEVNALEGELAGGLAGIREMLGGQIGAVRRELDGRVGPMELAVGLTIPAEIAVVAATFDNWLKGCGTPLCDGLGGLARFIPMLANLFGLGVFMTWLAYCVEDPVDAAHDTVTVAGPVADGVASTVKAAVGMVR